MERSTFEQPQKLSEGIKKVYAGRVLVRNHDRALGVRLGRALPH